MRWKRNNAFFQKLENENITEIYSYGFSFSDVDMIYIKKICSDVDTDNVIWYLNDYGLDDTKKSRIEEKIYVKNGGTLYITAKNHISERYPVIRHGKMRVKKNLIRIPRRKASEHRQPERALLKNLCLPVTHERKGEADLSNGKMVHS